MDMKIAASAVSLNSPYHIIYAVCLQQPLKFKSNDIHGVADVIKALHKGYSVVFGSRMLTGHGSLIGSTTY